MLFVRVVGLLNELNDFRFFDLDLLFDYFQFMIILLLLLLEMEMLVDEINLLNDNYFECYPFFIYSREHSCEHH